MAYTYKELKKQTVAQLREIASGLDHEAVQGYTQLNKEHLLEALCKALDIDVHEHHEVVGIDKTGIKARIKELKKRRGEALAARKYAEYKDILHQIHRLKHNLRRAAV